MVDLLKRAEDVVQGRAVGKALNQQPQVVLHRARIIGAFDIFGRTGGLLPSFLGGSRILLSKTEERFDRLLVCGSVSALETIRILQNQTTHNQDDLESQESSSSDAR